MPRIMWNEIPEGTIVCDSAGDEIGIVERVRLLDRAPGGGPISARGYVVCDCDPPNLSHVLYIPFDAFRDCTDDACYLRSGMEKIKRAGWERRPATV